MIGIEIRKGDLTEQKDSSRRAVAEAVDHIAYIRAMELATGNYTAEEFDALLNEESEKAYKKYEGMDLGELVIAGLMNVIEAKFKAKEEQEQWQGK